jgi:hypothetical protein
LDDRAARRARLQIRVLLLVYRAERARARRPGGNSELEHTVRRRSLEILDNVRASLNGAAPWHPEVIAELASARAEIASEA